MSSWLFKKPLHQLQLVLVGLHLRFRTLDDIVDALPCDMNHIADFGQIIIIVIIIIHDHFLLVCQQFSVEIKE